MSKLNEQSFCLRHPLPVCRALLPLVSTGTLHRLHQPKGVDGLTNLHRLCILLLGQGFVPHLSHWAGVIYHPSIITVFLQLARMYVAIYYH